MTTIVVCGVCKRRLKLPPHAMGRLVQCPGCQTTFTAQEPVDVAVAEEEIPVLEPVEPDPAPAPADALANLPGPRRPAPAAPAGSRRAVAQPPFWFPGRVVGDSERSLRGSVRLRVTQNGLEVWQGETLGLLVPLGTPAEADGARVRIRLDERRLELQVARGFGMSDRLAHDLAEFLAGRRRSLVPHHYRAPVGLLCLALLPLGIGLLAPSAWVWWVAAGGVAGLCLSLAWVDAWSRPARLAASAGLAGAGYLAVLLVAVVPRGGMSTRDSLPDSEWSHFSPAGNRYHARFPGQPIAVRQQMPGLDQPMTVFQVKHRGGTALFLVGEGRLVGQPGGAVNEDVSPADRFARSLRGLLARTPGSRLVSQLKISLQGWPGREFVIDVPGHGQSITRVFLVREYFYMLTVAGEGYKPTSPDVVRFLDSFRFPSDPSTWVPPEDVPAGPLPPALAGRAAIIRVLPAAGRQWVRALAFSADGKRLATGAGGRKGPPHAFVWDVDSGQLRTSVLSDYPVAASGAVAFSPDGRTLAAGRDDGQVLLWDLEAGVALRTLRLGHRSVDALAFSPDGLTLTAFSSERLAVFGVPGGEERVAVPQQPDWFDGNARALAALSPDGRALATSWEGHAVALREPARLLQQGLFRPCDRPHGLAFSGDGRRLATVDGQGQLAVWDTATLRAVKRTRWPREQPSAVAFAPDGRTLAAATGTQVVLFDAATLEQVHVCAYHRQAALSVAWSPDGKTLASGGADGLAVLWDVSRLADRAAPVVPPEPSRLNRRPDDGRLRFRLNSRDQEAAAIAYHPQGKVLAVLDRTGAVRLWDLETGAARTLREPDDGVRDWLRASPGRARLAFSADGKHLAVCDTDRATLFDLEPVPARREGWQVEGATDAAFARQGLVLTGPQGLDVYDPRSGRQTAGPPAAGLGVGPLAADGDDLYAGAGDLAVQSWPGGGGIAWVSEGHLHALVRLTTAGDLLASVDADGTLRVVSRADGQPRYQLRIEGAQPSLAATARVVAVGDSTGAVHLFDAPSGATLGRLALGHPVTSLCFSPDGRVLTVAAGESVGGWSVDRVLGPPGRPPAAPRDIRTATPTLNQLNRDGRARLTVPEGGTVTHFAFSPDGQRLALLTARNIQLFDLFTGRRLAVVGHGHSGGRLAFSPDGRYLATRGGTGLVRLRDPATGRVLASLPRASGLDVLGFDPTGKKLAAGLASAWVYDLSGPLPREERALDTRDAALLVFSGDGARTALLARPPAGRPPQLTEEARGFAGPCPVRLGPWVSSPDLATMAHHEDGRVRLFDTRRQRLIGTWQVPSGSTAVFAPDGQMVAVGDADGVRLWDPTAGGPQRILTADDGKRATAWVAFSPDGKVVAASRGNTVQLWKVDQAVAGPAPTVGGVHELTGLKGVVTHLAFSPDGRQLAASASASIRLKDNVRVWKVDDGSEVPLDIPDRDSGPPPPIFFTSNGEEFVVLHSLEVRRYPLRTGAVRVAPLEGPSPLRHAQDLSPDGKTLAVARHGEVFVYEVGTREPRHRLDSGSSLVGGVRLLDQGKQVAAVTAGPRPGLKIWDTQTGKLIREVDGPRVRARHFLIGSDARVVVCVGPPLTVHLWEPETGRGSALAEPLPGVAGPVAAISADGRLVAVGTVGGSILLHDRESARTVRPSVLPGRPVRALAFSPDARRLAVAVRDEPVRLFEVAALLKHAVKP